MPSQTLNHLTCAVLFASVAAAGAARSAESLIPVVHYRSAKVDGVTIAYREAGPADGPVVVLFHGFPTSSRMFRRLIPTLADRYRVIAPDFPGFGGSDAPDHTQFAYTFDHYASLMNALLEKVGATQYAMYSFDYGAPVSYRVALKHPERVTGLIIQNGNAYDEGLREFWDPMKAYWADGSDMHRQALAFIVGPDAVKWQYTNGVSDTSRLDPDSWSADQVLLDRAGNKEIQLDLFYDYRTNVTIYPEFQKFFRTSQPPSLVVWGKNDVVFPVEGAEPYRRDMPATEFHLIDTGHFVLEDKFAEVAPLIRDFLDRRVQPRVAER